MVRILFKEWAFTCECWYSDHTYSITCPGCKRENEIDGKGNLIKRKWFELLHNSEK